MARVASNPLSLPRFRPYFQVSDSTHHLFKSPSLSQNRIRKFQTIACQTNPIPAETESSDKEKVLVELDSVKDSTSEATTSSDGGGSSEFPNKNFSRRIAVGSTLAAVGLFLSSRLDFGVSLKDLSAEAVPFEEALSNGKPTVVEFYADWCEVCRELAPDIYKVEQQYRDRVNFVMLNVDNTKWEQELDEFGVEGIPHFAFLDKEGNEEGNVVGKLPRKYFLENVEALARGEASVPHYREVGQYSSAESRRVHGVVDPRSHV
ncbi:HCF164 protein [Hibiscus syriacus]|uniref:Thioredoxin-like protein HCF164, chloroplastic n=1 Tax=Hibiscus syriacus TaxID=106335 RepID=A0A6A3BIZ9_HIBSY|nr:thioredoxin-like protein HCF164, chloroplastic [Hibiscus syriacus]KAE8716644.1 HCF164 protein [Hibiscus syriacus]